MKYEVENGVLRRCIPEGKEKEIIVPEGVEALSFDAFSVFDCPVGQETIEKVVFPEGLKEIGGMNMGWVSGGLKTLVLPESLQDWKNVYRSYQKGLECIWIKRWPRELTPVVKHLKLREVHTDDVAAVPVQFREAAVLGFVLEQETDIQSVRAQSYCAYIKRNAGKLLPFAFEHPEVLRLMVREKLIPAKVMDDYLQAAARCGDAELNALLLDYQQNTLGTEAVKKARERKEKTAERDTNTVIGRAEKRLDRNGIQGLVFAVTGKLNTFDNRDECKAWLEAHDAALASDVSAKVDYLVTNDADTRSEKNGKARDLGIEVITEAAFNLLIGRRYPDAEKIVIPDWVRRIANHAFSGCVGVKEIVLHDGIESIGKYAFSDCPALERIRIPASVKSIGNGAFSMTRHRGTICALRAVEVSPDSETFSSVDGVLLSKDGTQLICYPVGKEQEEYEIPAGVTFVAKGAFDCCDHLSKIIVPASVRTLDSFCITDCRKLETLALRGKSMECSGFSVFSCAQLSSLEIVQWLPAMNEWVRNFASIRVQEPSTVPAQYRGLIVREGEPAGNALPDTLAGLVFAAVGKFQTFQSKEEAADYLRQYGAKMAGSISGKVNYVVMCGDSPGTDKAEKAVQAGIPVISEYEFNCIIRRRFRDEPVVQVPSWITKIEDKACENCTHIKKLILPDTIRVIGRSAFSGCTALEDIQLPEGLETICDDAFRGCSSLKSILLPASIRNVNNAFAWRTYEDAHIGIESFAVNPDNPIYTSVDGVLCTKEDAKSVLVDAATLVRYPVGRMDESYSVPDFVRVIGNDAFSGAESLRKINLPGDLEEIGYSAFEHCGSLSAIIIPDSVIAIDGDAFTDCKKLEELVFLGEVPEMDEDDEVFGESPKIRRITVPCWTDSLTEQLGNAPLEEIRTDCPDDLPEAYRHLRR